MKRQALILTLLAACAVVMTGWSAVGQAPVTPPAAPKTNDYSPKYFTKPEKHQFEINGLKVTVICKREMMAKKDMPFIFELPDGTPAPQSVQVWSAGHDGVASKPKSQAKVDAKGLWSTVVKPPAIDATTRLWVSMEFEAGKPVTGSINLDVFARPQ